MLDFLTRDVHEFKLCLIIKKKKIIFFRLNNICVFRWKSYKYHYLAYLLFFWFVRTKLFRFHKNPQQFKTKITDDCNTYCRYQYNYYGIKFMKTFLTQNLSFISPSIQYFPHLQQLPAQEQYPTFLFLCVWMRYHWCAYASRNVFNGLVAGDPRRVVGGRSASVT